MKTGITSALEMRANADARPDAVNVEECFATLCNLPGVVVYQRAVKPDGTIRYNFISEGAKDLFEVSAEEILLNPNALFSTHGPDYKAKFRERLLAASAALTDWDVEASLVTPSGKKKFTHAIARPQRKADGSVVWTGVILDETRTRTAIIENLSQGLLVYDSDDRLVMRNSHYTTLFPSLAGTVVPGATYEEVVRAELNRNYNPSDNGDANPEFARSLDRHQQGHSMFERELGDDRWALVNEHRTADGGTIVLYTDISELKRRDRELQHMAHHDALTGLPNRELFHRRVAEALSSARSRGWTVGIMCLDLDYFKNINDTLGHAAGDHLLRCVAERLRSCFRGDETVARLGGDEFAVVLGNLSKPEAAATLAEQLIGVVGQPVDYNGQMITTGLSIGIALSSDGSDGEAILKNADLALYRSKADGRGTFRFFEAEMDARAQARRALEIALRQALSRNELEVHYQPQVDIYTDEIVAFEALVRWRHSERGLISPVEFIPLAEETGIIHRLGEWVLRRACMDAKGWPETVRISVNVSPAQFRNQDVAGMVRDVLKETAFPPNRLELEITESILLKDVDANLKTLHDLKTLGIRIAMDDFGTGYSSLGNLRSFPFDKIKIDRSFVMDLEQNPDSAAIVHAILGLGHSLGISTCAEGVETKAQLTYLKREGCAEVQGYYYSKPKPYPEAVAMFAQRSAPAAPPLVPSDNEADAVARTSDTKAVDHVE
ncbi:MAG: EAL domain-containing protein [Alphaproteobacteria bacterium]|nr:EAL domain-containing protein [Alphaproteobacteria bacterium]